MRKIEYRCTHGAGTGIQCIRVASRKINDRWLCLAHLDTKTPLIKDPKPYLGSGKNATPEERKAYNRRYRREYRAVHGRKRVYVWPKIIYQGGWFDSSQLWLAIPSLSSSLATYHCDRCCQKVEVKRVACAPTVTPRWDTAHFWVAGTHYRASTKHKCEPFPLTKLVHCHRCGRIGTRHLINNRRYPHSYYGDELCLDCWRRVRSLYLLHADEMKLYELLKKFRSTMRQAKITPHKVILQREIMGLDYREGWYCERKRGHGG